MSVPLAALAAPTAMAPVAEPTNLGAAFAALPQLVGTAQGKMGAAQGLISNFMQMLPMMERYYQWSHLSPYQGATVDYHNAMLQGYYIPRVQQEALANQIRAGTLGLDTQKYGSQLGQWNFLDQKAVDQLKMLGYHYLNPFGNLSNPGKGSIPGLTYPTAPSVTYNLPNGQSLTFGPHPGSSGGSGGSTWPLSPGQSAPSSGGSKNPLGF